MSDLQPGVLLSRRTTTKHCPSLRQFMSRDSAALHGSLSVSTTPSSSRPVVNVVGVVVVLRPRRRDPPPPRRRPFGLLVGLVLDFVRLPRPAVVVVVSSVDDITTSRCRHDSFPSETVLQYDEYTGSGWRKTKCTTFHFYTVDLSHMRKANVTHPEIL